MKNTVHFLCYSFFLEKNVEKIAILPQPFFFKILLRIFNFWAGGKK